MSTTMEHTKPELPSYEHINDLYWPTIDKWFKKDIPDPITESNWMLVFIDQSIPRPSGMSYAMMYEEAKKDETLKPYADQLIDLINTHPYYIEKRYQRDVSQISNQAFSCGEETISYKQWLMGLAMQGLCGSVFREQPQHPTADEIAWKAKEIVEAIIKIQCQ